MGFIGHGFQILGLLSGIAAILFYSLGLRTCNPVYRSYGNLQRGVQSLAIVVATTVLLYYILSDDFSLRYTAIYGDRMLPLLYKISVLWAGQSGALLTGAALFSLFSLIETVRLNKSEERYACAVSIFITIFICVIIALTIFVTNPFAELDYIPANGSGLQPELQNIYIFLYPVFMCLWISGAFIAFSHGAAALITFDTSPYWVKGTKTWVAFSWFVLSVAIILRSIWSYRLTGEFWSWQVQEVTSLVALLSLTAFIHTSFTYVSKGRMKIASFLYLFTFFQSALFSLYLIHSGAKDIVTPFRYAPCGIYFLIFMAISTVFFAIFMVLNRKGIKSGKPSVTHIKDVAFRALNIIFATLLIFMFAGILFQITVELQDIHTGYYYLAIIIPTLTLALLLMITVQIYSLWRQSKFTSKKYKICVRGGITAHLGFLLICIAIVSSTIYKDRIRVVTFPSSDIILEDYKVVTGGVSSSQKNNYVSTSVDVSLYYKEKMLGNIHPEIRGYNNSNKLVAETKSIVDGFRLVSVAFISYDFSSKEVRLLIMDYPFVLLALPGFFLLAFGILRVMKRDRVG